MSNLYRRLRTLACACATLLLATITHASATTIALESGASETSFSINPGYHDTLSVGPVINVNSNGCPGAHCSNSFWNVGLNGGFFRTNRESAGHVFVCSRRGLHSRQLYGSEFCFISKFPTVPRVLRSSTL